MRGKHGPVFDSLEVEKSLGWRVFGIPSGEIAKAVSSNELREIIQLRSGKLVYAIRAFPQLSIQEAALLKSAIDYYRGANPKIGMQTPQDALEKFCEANFFELEGAQAEYLRRVISCIAQPTGALSEFLKDPSLEEIAVIGTGRSRPVHVFDSSFGWLETNLYFSSEDEVRNTVNAMASGIGRGITFQKPELNATLAGGS